MYFGIGYLLKGEVKGKGESKGKAASDQTSGMLKKLSIGGREMLQLCIYKYKGAHTVIASLE